MRRRTFWRTVTVDTSSLLDRLLALLRERHVRFCVIGGQGVNAYAEPVVSLDLDIVVAVDDLDALTATLDSLFRGERIEHSLKISADGSDLRVQIQLDPRYDAFVSRAHEQDVLGERLPVARIEDVLQGRSGQRRIRRAPRASGRRTWPTSPASSRWSRSCVHGSRNRFSTGCC